MKPISQYIWLDYIAFAAIAIIFVRFGIQRIKKLKRVPVLLDTGFPIYRYPAGELKFILFIFSFVLSAVLKLFFVDYLGHWQTYFVKDATVYQMANYLNLFFCGSLFMEISKDNSKLEFFPPIFLGLVNGILLTARRS